jgi:hypothetical protein
VSIFTEVSYKKDKNHSYAAGYLEGAVTAMYTSLPEDKKLEFVNQFLTAVKGDI